MRKCFIFIILIIGSNLFAAGNRPIIFPKAISEKIEVKPGKVIEFMFNNPNNNRYFYIGITNTLPYITDDNWRYLKLDCSLKWTFCFDDEIRSTVVKLNRYKSRSKNRGDNKWNLGWFIDFGENITTNEIKVVVEILEDCESDLKECSFVMSSPIHLFDDPILVLK